MSPLVHPLSRVLGSSLCAAFLLLACNAPAATPSTDTPANPSPTAAPPSENAFPTLTGDWGGFRSRLKENGVLFLADYTAEVFGNPKGGRSRGTVFDGLLKMTLEVDLAKTLGWHGATFRISGLYPHGTSGSLEHVGDAALFSNIDAYDSYRLIDLWLEQKLLDGKVSLKLGQMRVDDEFGVTETAGVFINSTTGVPSPTLTPMPLAVYPLGGLGIRLRLEPVPGLYAQLGVYDGNPSAPDLADPTDGSQGRGSRHGTDWALRKSEGTLYAVETGFQHSQDTYPGAIRLGLLHHTDQFAEVFSTNPGLRDSSTSEYCVVDQTVWKNPTSPKQTLAAFFRGTLAGEATATLSHTVQTGLVVSGLVSEADKLGVAYVRNAYSPRQAGDPTREAVAELTYQIPLKPYLRIQPDLQYISRPAGTTQCGNAWVVGIRALIDF